MPSKGNGPGLPGPNAGLSAHPDGGLAGPVIVKPLSQSVMWSRPNWMHGPVAFVHVTSQVSLLFSVMTIVAAMRPQMSREKTVRLISASSPGLRESAVPTDAGGRESEQPNAASDRNRADVDRSERVHRADSMSASSNGNGCGSCGCARVRTAGRASGGPSPVGLASSANAARSGAGGLFASAGRVHRVVPTYRAESACPDMAGGAGPGRGAASPPRLQILLVDILPDAQNTLAECR